MQPATILSQVLPLQRLSDENRIALMALLKRRRYAKGEVIFRVEDPGTTCYIIEAGRVRISLDSADGRQMTIALLGPGDLFGELALLDGDPRSADAVTLERCQLLELRREDFHEFLRTHWSATNGLLISLASRLRRTDELLQDAVFRQVPDRLAKVLLGLADSQGEQVATGIRIGTRLTQSDLAALVGATRESVNKWLNFYQQQGIVLLDAGNIVVSRPDELRRNVY